MELSSLIDKLEETIGSGTVVPATRRVLIERDKLSSLVSQIRAAIPSDIHEAHEFLQMRETMLNQALMESRRIKTAAEENARERVKESEITSEARKQAEAIIAEAQRKAQRILDEADAQFRLRLAGADEYSQATLRKLEEDLTQVLSTVHRGLERLGTEKDSSG